VAVTQILRPGDPDMIMGRSIRTPQWRYTEWNGGAAGVELYDEIHDPHEFTNLADTPKLQPVLRQLRKELSTRARDLPPESPVEQSKL
jgi:hypothetical protein